VWVLAGGLFALAARGAGRRGLGAVAWASGSAGVLSLVIETLQLAIPGRTVDMTSVALAVLGSASGAAPVASTADDEPRRWIEPALLIWGLAALMGAWDPPQFVWPVPPYWRRAMFVPFWSYFDSRTMDDLADVVKQALVFVPLGVLLAARSRRQSLPGVMFLGLVLGIILEFGQAFLPTRTPDVTDALSAAAGAGLGLSLWRWGEWARTSSIGVARYRVGRRSGLSR
jgi:VanZ family protein